MPLDILNFVRKWQQSSLTERSGYQDHFRDLCEALGVPRPNDQDVDGSSYTYEKHVPKTGTDDKGFADVWKRGWFAWEYKSKGGDLKAAYKQVNQYHEALENPPLLVVCDFDRFEVHTKFENLPSRTYAFTLEDLLHPDRDTPTSAVPPLEVLRHTFGDFNELRPDRTAARVTEAAAADFLRLAQQLELERAADPNPPTKEQIAHFLMRLVFCLFADSVKLIPNHAFRKLVKNDRFSPIGFNKKLPVLFEAMSNPDGFFGADNIPHFNGDLFKPNDHMIPLNTADLGILYSAAQHDWSHIEPSIFGTLFERSLDAAKRSLIGAHYTSPEDILLLVEPVVMQPLYRRWADVQKAVESALAEEEATAADSKKPKKLSINRPALEILQNWATELSSIRVLDPACGSGNFLYITLKRLLDLWHEARIFGIRRGLTLAVEPIPSPEQLFGIETDFYAHEIASIVVWIGFLQWKHEHGVEDHKTPLLRKLANIEHGDAIMRYGVDGKPFEPEWPEVEYIVGNPPFLGDKKMRSELNLEPHLDYVDELRSLYEGRVPGGSDLVTYWFEKARAQIKAARANRAGLLATQAIRGGANRSILDRIKESGDIFLAYADRDWTLDGAVVHVSLIGFDDGSEKLRTLDGSPVESINSNLTNGLDLNSAHRLTENAEVCFTGVQRGGAFDISTEEASAMLKAPPNPNGRPNSDVIKRWVNAADITGRARNRFIIDFGTDTTESEAALYEWPFEYLLKHVQPFRAGVRRDAYREKWWIHQEARPGLRKAIENVPKYIATPLVSKHRVFVFLPNDVIPENLVITFARPDDYFFGVLHSRAHETWSRALGTQLREATSGLRYTASTTFDTFPFPWPPGEEPKADPRVEAIAAVAHELLEKRDAWLNPPNTPEAELKKRTLTNLYNDRPTWLDNLHRDLDDAVFAAYGWPADLTDDQILERILALNHERAANQ